MVPTNALPANWKEACHAALFAAWPPSAPWRHVVRVTPVLRLSAHSTWALCGLLPVRPPCSYCCNRRFVRVLGSCHRALVSGAALCISARRVGLSLLMAATVECGHSLKVVVRRSDVARSGHVVVLACGVALGVGHDVLLVNCINSGGSQLVSELRIQGCARLSLLSVRWGTLPHSSDHSRQAGICFQFGPCCAISNRVLPSATGMDALAREINGRPCATELASIQTASTAHARSGPGPIERLRVQAHRRLQPLRIPCGMLNAGRRPCNGFLKTGCGSCSLLRSSQCTCLGTAATVGMGAALGPTGQTMTARPQPRASPLPVPKLRVINTDRRTLVPLGGWKC